MRGRPGMKFKEGAANDKRPPHAGRLEDGAWIRANAEPTPIHALLALQGRSTSGK